MESSVRGEIVKIILEDDDVYNKKREFWDLLNLPSGDFDLVDKKNQERYGFFRDVLDKWIAKSGNDGSVIKLHEICYQNDFKFIAEKLQEKFSAEFSSISNHNNLENEPLSFEVNKEAPNFTGRVKELAQLNVMFCENIEYLVTVTGMGGIGKSELVKRFARQIHEDHLVSVIWLNGESNQTLCESVARLAEQVFDRPTDLNPKNIQHSFTKIVSSIKSKNKKILVIVDNVDDENENVVKLIQLGKKIQVSGYLFFIVTSRNKNVLKSAGKIIELDIFADPDAIELVSNSVNDTLNDDVKKLCRLLHNFPLALQQAVAYIQEEKLTSSQGNNYKISDYIQSFAEKRKEYLNYELNLDHDYKFTTFITWKITMDKIYNKTAVGELAIAILDSIAYFEPDRIPVGFIKQIFEGKEVEKAIQLIKTYNLVKSEANLVSMHRLVQQVIQINKSDNDLEISHLRNITSVISNILENGEQEIILHQPKLIIDKNLSSKPLDENLLLVGIRSAILHILSVWNHDCKYRELINEFKRLPIKIISVVYPIRSSKNRRIREVFYFTSATFHRFKNIFGNGAIETLEMEREVALASGFKWCQSKQGHYFPYKKISDFKQKLLQETYDRQQKILGENDILNQTMLEKLVYSHYFGFRKDKCVQYCKAFLKFKTLASVPNVGSDISVRYILIKSLPVGVNNNSEIRDQCFYFWEEAKLLKCEIPDEGFKILLPFSKELFLHTKAEKSSQRILNKRIALIREVQNDAAVLKSDEWNLTAILYHCGEFDAAVKKLETWVVSWENEEKKTNKFTQMRALFYKADSLVKNEQFLGAANMYEILNNYQNTDNLSKYYSNPDYKWWEYVTFVKRAFCLIQLQRLEEAGQVLALVPTDYDSHLNNERKKIKVLWKQCLKRKHYADIKNNIQSKRSRQQ